MTQKMSKQLNFTRFFYISTQAMNITNTHTNQSTRSHKRRERMKYSNLEADSVYGYLIWVIPFEYKYEVYKKNTTVKDIPSVGHKMPFLYFHIDLFT